jgi:hypothetical protein
MSLMCRCCWSVCRSSAELSGRMGDTSPLVIDRASQFSILNDYKAHQSVVMLLNKLSYCEQLDHLDGIMPRALTPSLCRVANIIQYAEEKERQNDSRMRKTGDVNCRIGSGTTHMHSRYRHGRFPLEVRSVCCIAGSE